MNKKLVDKYVREAIVTLAAWHKADVWAERWDNIIVVSLDAPGGGKPSNPGADDGGPYSFRLVWRVADLLEAGRLGWLNDIEVITDNLGLDRDDVQDDFWNARYDDGKLWINPEGDCVEVPIPDIAPHVSLDECMRTFCLAP